MKQCPYCGYAANADTATECQKCGEALFIPRATIYKSYWVGPEKARAIRGKALSAIVLGLLIKVYWGGYGPWPIIDNSTLANLRTWLEPWLLYGGGLAYVVGWILRWL